MLKNVLLALAAITVSVSMGSVATGAQGHGTPGKKAALTCPVMKAPVKDPAKAPKLMVNMQPVYFCCPGCAPQVKKDPAKYVKTTRDLVTGKSFAVTAKTPKLEHGGGLFLFSSPGTLQKFHADPGKYIHDPHAGHGDHRGH